MNESQAYDAIRGAVFGVAEQAECSVQTQIGILEIVKAELMSTVMEDVPEEGEEQGPLEVCPGSPGGPSAAAVSWPGLDSQRWPPHSRTLLPQAI
jgi:hypothetical protein